MAQGANAPYAEGMASTPFTLAALATSAVPGLSVTGTRPYTSGNGGAFASAVLSTSEGEVIVRVPQSPNAEVQQAAELLALATLAEGARGGLPFAVPTILGLTRAGDTRAVVSTFLPGEPAAMEHVVGDSDLLQGTAEAIAAIHGLPTGIVREGGLPTRSVEDSRAVTERLVKRATDTGVLPATVRRHWQHLLDADPVWSFEPVPVHGSLAPEFLLVDGSKLRGVLGWGNLSLGDPATDLGWLQGAGSEAFEAALAHYAAERGIGGLQELTTRARLYHELEVAKWLLHGTETHDQTVVDDAVQMLDRLVDRLGKHEAPLPKRHVLSDHEVEQLLDETPGIDYDPRSETAEFESLDEDRAFGVDHDFTESAADGDDSSKGDSEGGSESGPNDKSLRN